MEEQNNLEFRKLVLRRVSFDKQLFLKEWFKAKKALKTTEDELALDNFVQNEFPEFYHFGETQNLNQIGKLG